MKLSNKIIPFKRTTLVLGLIFISFVISYGNNTRGKIQESVDEHARVIAESIWAFDPNMHAEYLFEAVDHHGYAHLTVMSTTGDAIHEITSPPANKLERILVFLQLTPYYDLTSDIYHEEQKIGTISVKWQCKTIYTYTYAAVLLVLLVLIIRLFNRIAYANRFLEDRVFERTQELQASEAKYREIFDSPTDAILLHDEETGAILDVNQTMLDMYGYDYQDVPKLKISDLSSNESPFAEGAAIDHVRKAVEQGAQLFEWQACRKNGEHFWVEVALKKIEIDGKAQVLAVVRDVSLRKEAELAAHEKEIRYATLFESAGDGILIMKDDTFINCNQKALDLFNCQREQIIGQSPLLFSPAEQPDGRDSRDKALEKINKTLAGEAQQFEWLHHKYGGELFDAEISLNSIETNKVKYIQAIVRDISNRKKAETELRKNQEQQALILRSLPMAFYVAQPFDTYGGTWVSEQIEALSGFTPEQFAADISLWANRLHPDDRQRVIEEFEKIHATGNIAVEYRWQGTDNNYLWFHDEAVLIRDEKGEPKEIIGTWLDITERRQEQEQLLLTKQTVDHGSTPIIWFKIPYQFYYVNEAICKLTGYSREEMLNLPPGGLHPQKTTKYWDTLLPFLKKEKSITREIELRKKNGKNTPVLMNATYLEYQGIEYVIANFYDLSDRRKLESELHQAQKMEAIGTLAGGIAHDFNNILSAIFGFNELAQMHIKDEAKLSGDLTEVRHAAERARDLVKQILTFSRRSGQEKQPLQVALIIKEALKLLRASIPSTIAIQQNISSKAHVLADPTQIHQIVMNLCTNAYQAMRETGGIMAVSLKEIEIHSHDQILGINLPPGDYIQLEVSDTGPGMDEEVKEKIFEPYFTTKQVGEGTGMGLSVVHGIVQNHHGRLEVYSEPGKGSTFHVYLPRVTEENSDSIKKIDTGPQTGNERVLFVDDAEELVKLTREILSAYGYHITSFDSGVAAWENFKEHPDNFDIIITDQTMPGMTGSDLAQKIKTLRPKLPIILCTGFSETINKKKALALGIDKYVQKPVVMSSLLKTIRQLLDKSLRNG